MLICVQQHSNHNYYEWESNVRGAYWELTMEKPYKDGGPARYPRNLPNTHLGVRVLGRGALNDPRRYVRARAGSCESLLAFTMPLCV